MRKHWDTEASEEDSDVEVDVENMYYTAKADAHENRIDDAIEGFETILLLEDGTDTKYTFRSLLHLVKHLYRLDRLDDMLTRYNQLLECVNGDVRHSTAERALEKLLLQMKRQKNKTIVRNTEHIPVVEYVFDITLQTLKDMKKEKLWYRFAIDAAKYFLENRQFTRVSILTDELHSKTTETERDINVVAIQIQMYSMLENDTKLKELRALIWAHRNSVQLKHLFAIIRECLGKMYTRQRKYKKALKEFDQARDMNIEIDNIKEGNRCLRYHLLVIMLDGQPSEHNVLILERTSTRQKLSDDKYFVFLKLLRNVYENDYNAFMKNLKVHDVVLKDSFVCSGILELVRRMKDYSIKKDYFTDVTIKH